MRVVAINKHFFACGFNFITTLYIYLFAMPLFAQDTVSLNVVNVFAKKIELSQIGKKIEKIDSTIKNQFRFNSISDLLSLNTPIFIKNYGPGALSTTAFRGGNASQTAILWNGFNIQNAMLGQSDLTLIPSFLFEKIEVEYGGSSSLWGSGAVGGSIHLINNSLFNQGLTTTTSYLASSFGLKNMATTILLSKKRFTSSTKLYNHYSKNNFDYKDITDSQGAIKQQKNANYNFLGLMQELKFLINNKQIISVNAWISNNRRRLPAYDLFSDSKSYQQDNSIRITANWSYLSARFKSNIRTGYFKDKINYTDSLTTTFSKSDSETLIAENENYFTWHKKQVINFGVNFTSNSAITNNYITTKTINKVSFLAGNKFSFFDDRLLTYLSARADYYSIGALPLTGNLATEYHFNTHFFITGSMANVYRQPTLNEMYWLPGGNSNLKPEQGYTYEGALNYKHALGDFFVSFSAAVFSRKINDWILWVPGFNANPTPINLQQVWSRGTETTCKLNYTHNKFQCRLNVVTGYVLSTIESTNQENNNTINKQLIYTPRYTVNSIFLVGYGKSILTFYHQYVGFRFTSSDNSEWLNPYAISSLRLNYPLNLKSICFSVFAASNNIFNKDYMVLSGRPMPLRNYEFGITLQTKTKKQ